MPIERAAGSAEELAMLRGVVEDLNDPLPLLVYCDWLADCEDTREPYLREFLRAFAAKEPLPPEPPGLPPAWIDILALRPRRKLREERGYLRESRQRWQTDSIPRGFDEIEPYFHLLLASAKPAIRFHLGEGRPVEDFPLGTSRAGGRCDLATGSEWPTFEYYDKLDYPLHFLLQIDLAELRGTFAADLLPPDGLISIFQSPPPDLPGKQLIFTPAGTPLERMTPPSPYRWHPSERGEEEFPSHTSHALMMADALRFSRDHPDLPRHLGPYANRGGDNVDYFALLAESALESRDLSSYEHWAFSRWDREMDLELGGIQRDPLADPWMQLFELRSGDALDWGFGDGARFHMYGPVADIRRGIFDLVYPDEI